MVRLAVFREDRPLIGRLVGTSVGWVVGMLVCLFVFGQGGWWASKRWTKQTLAGAGATALLRVSYFSTQSVGSISHRHRVAVHPIVHELPRLHLLERRGLRRRPNRRAVR